MALAPTGVIHIVINNKQMDTGRFLFNLNKDTKAEVSKKLHQKLEEFFKWYCGFQNKEAISRLSIYSSDFVCTQGCNIPINSAISVVGQLFPTREVQKEIENLGQKYGLQIEIDLQD